MSWFGIGGGGGVRHIFHKGKFNTRFSTKETIFSFTCPIRLFLFDGDVLFVASNGVIFCSLFALQCISIMFPTKKNVTS